MYAPDHELPPPQAADSDSRDELTPRFPIRWRWTMLVGLAVASAVLVLSYVILDIERDAWLENQDAQAKVLVERLGDELKIPLLGGSSVEIEVIIQGDKGFLKKVPNVLAVHIQPSNGHDIHFGQIDQADEPLLNRSDIGVKAARLPSERLWYARQIVYAGTVVGSVAVRFSEKAWEELAGRLVTRLSLAAAIVVILSSIMIYWIAGRMSEPMEMLADAARQVAEGDYDIRLPVRGNDEISDAVSQFNVMTYELAQKERIRDVFGRYLNPKLVADVFDGEINTAENRRQEVTVLFADMVGFTAFSESTETEQIVEVLNKHFEVFHRIIDYYGGHVDKYIGDAVMAVFNHPREDVEHARHAAMAALAMIMACSKLGVLRDNGEPIQFRIGLNCGQAIVGNIGAAERLEYTVIGNTVNVASRMGGIGGGGEVVMSEATFDSIGSDFEFDDLGEKEVKGVSQPIRCGRVTTLNDDIRQDIVHAVALAFDLTLSSDVREIIGKIEESPA